MFINDVSYTKLKPTPVNDLLLRKINSIKNDNTFLDNESLWLKELPGSVYVCILCYVCAVSYIIAFIIYICVY